MVDTKSADAEALEDAFGHVDEEHFHWQTEAPEIKERERELVRSAFLPLGQKILDLGCGEGATLYHLGLPEGAHGIELFDEKVKFARARFPTCHFVQGSVYELPYESASFDQLIVRDLIHHLEEPGRFMTECARVLVPGGRIDVLEPCRYNPLILAHALMNRAERGELKSTPGYLSGLLAAHFRIESLQRYQPLPIHRLVYHPTLGSAASAQVPWVKRLVDGVELLASHCMPRASWAYIHLRAFSKAGSHTGSSA